jgi:signal peptidase II
MRLFGYYFSAFLLVLADQLSKLWVFKSLQLYQSIEITPFFNLTYVHNYGAAFSLLADENGWQQIFLSGISIIASIAIIIWMAKTHKNDTSKLTALSLILAGAVGNLIDRVSAGFVIDFIDLHLQGWHWAVFNVADALISIGVILLIIVDFKTDKKSDE